MKDWDCPLPLSDYPRVLLAHGGGGRLMDQLLEKIFRPAFSSPHLDHRHDGAIFAASGRLAITTDSYVVRPLFFPGGDIGKLAVAGTANDLAMCGARPRYLSCGFVLEEGLPMEELWQIVQSMAATAKVAGMEVITGDTKVVDRGKGDGVFINTTGVGEVCSQWEIDPGHIQPGDAILVSGDIGRHGTAVMASRGGLGFQTSLQSDVDVLWPVVERLLGSPASIHCLRDLTRGGLYSNLIELAEASDLTFHIHEDALPVHEEVRGACEILGLEPGYVACEGRFVALVPEAGTAGALEAMGDAATRIGEVTASGNGVILQGTLGVDRRLQKLSGEQLPRIC